MQTPFKFLGLIYDQSYSGYDHRCNWHFDISGHEPLFWNSILLDKDDTTRTFETLFLGTFPMAVMLPNRNRICPDPRLKVTNKETP
jgi:hypothetical protein